MRFSYLLTLLYLLPVLLLASCDQAEQPPEPRPLSLEEALTSTDAINRVPTVEATDLNLKPPHLQLALQYRGTVELGSNRGPEVERFLRAVGLGAGNPYCAAFVSFALDEAETIRRPQIRSALASDFITDRSIEARKILRGTYTVLPGTILVWQKGNTIYGHTGFVIGWEQAAGTTIEANTSSGTYGSQRDGEGVFRRKRTIQPGNYFRITHFTPVVYARAS